MVRPSSRISCLACSAISGGMEKVMTRDFLGVVILSFLPLCVLQCHTLII